MAMTVLIDTSAWVEALRADGDDSMRREVQLALEDGTAAFCDMILLELWSGARGNRERKYLKALEGDIECLPTTAEVWKRSRDLARRCRQAGLTIPATDILIAACALHHGARVLHRDRHFEQIQKLAG